MLGVKYPKRNNLFLESTKILLSFMLRIKSNVCNEKRVKTLFLVVHGYKMSIFYLWQGTTLPTYSIHRQAKV